VCANCQLKLLLNDPSISPVGAMPSNADAAHATE
jgi:hypothetical protein